MTRFDLVKDVLVLAACVAMAPLLTAPAATAEKGAKGEAHESGAAARWQGTIPVQGKHSEAELRKMAKISASAAKRTALAAVEGKASRKKVGEAELEVENGYLIYSVDVKVAHAEGVEEILVDAGSGKVLAHEHESAQSEAREKQQEKHEKLHK